MPKTILILLLGVLGALLLTGCKATNVDLKISDKMVLAALSGEEQRAEFLAEFSLIGQFDDERKSQMARVQAIVESAMEIEDFEVLRDNYGVKIQMEGTLPVVKATTSGAISAESPWAVVVREIDFTWLPQHKLVVAVEPTKAFENFRSQLSGVSFLLAPRPFQPLRIRLRNRSGKKLSVVAPASEYDGRVHALGVTGVPKKKNFSFRDGAYDHTPASLFLSFE